MTAAVANAPIMNSKPTEDGDIDQIGSTSSTPPGAATPRPDLIDKRLPGILHTYFGQVRDSTSSPQSLSAASPTHTSPAHTPPQAQRCKAQQEHQSKMGVHALPTAPASPAEASLAADDMAPLLPHEQIQLPIRPSNPSLEPSAAYPTPPESSASSMHKVRPEEPGGQDVSKLVLNPRSRLSQADLATQGVLPPSNRRHTINHSNPLALVTATAHISNPASKISSTTPSSPIVAALSASRRASFSKSPTKGKELTESSLSNQNTPPQTPRTRSHEGRPTPSKRSVAAPSQVKEQEPATIGPVLGKLSVCITEGRGLRPSFDPYVVCQFQQAEYISEGPRHTEDGALGAAAIPMQRSGSDTGRPRAIPMKSRQSSHTGLPDLKLGRTSSRETSDPVWGHEATFDVVGEHSEIDISVYDRSSGEAFLGHVRFCPSLIEYDKPYDGWFTLEPREGEEEAHITGEVHLQINFKKTEKKHYGPQDFQILKLIGKGTFGQVYQVRKKDTQRIYAMKVLSKKVIVQKKEVAHTLGERNILVRTAMADSPFIVGLKFSFQTPTDLYLVTDYMSGGELFWHLQKEGRFQEHRAKFYIAELILALQHLHDHDIVYRDLKPENILLDANGHIALCDFGLSKANLAENATTNTFCGTTEYLAPEVLLDEHGYTKMVDFWSLGVLVFEMCCGWSPFYAEDTQQMYKNIAFGKVRFPRDALSNEGRNFVKGLLNRNPKHRLGANGDAQELKNHPFFADVEWDALAKKNVVPPFKPVLKGELDVSNFDPEFTNALNNGAGSLNARAAAIAGAAHPASTPLSPTVQANFKGFTFVDESAMEKQFGNQSLNDHNDQQDRMDEDKGDEDWEMVSRNRGDRMSGVVPSSTTMGPGEHDDTGFQMD